MDDAVRKFTFLYDKTHKDFKNKSCRENAWTTIAGILNGSAEEVENRWVGLRNRYCAEKRKIRCMPTGSGAYSDWKLFIVLTFLDPYIATRKTQSNVKIQDITQVSAGTENLWETQVLTPIENLSEEEASGSGTTYRNVQSTETTPTARTSMQDEHKKRLNTKNGRRRKFKNPLEECITGAFSKLEKFMTTSEEDPETENSLFGKIVGQSLDHLQNRKKQARARKDILEILEIYESD